MMSCYRNPSTFRQSSCCPFHLWNSHNRWLRIGTILRPDVSIDIHTRRGNNPCSHDIKTEYNLVTLFFPNSHFTIQIPFSCFSPNNIASIRQLAHFSVLCISFKVFQDFTPLAHFFVKHIWHTSHHSSQITTTTLSKIDIFPTWTFFTLQIRLLFLSNINSCQHDSLPHWDWTEMLVSAFESIKTSLTT